MHIGWLTGHHSCQAEIDKLYGQTSKVLMKTFRKTANPIINGQLAHYSYAWLLKLTLSVKLQSFKVNCSGEVESCYVLLLGD